MAEHSDLAARVGKGLLSFPVTHFRSDLSFDEAAYRQHVAWLLEHAPAGIFAPGGTGEFFSLSPGEVEAVARAAVAETKGRVPVIAGVGYGHGLAIELAQAAERAGADGILLLPPYLVNSDQAGLVAHIRKVCAATRLGVIVYNRDNAILDENSVATLAENCPNLIGFKDGVGDIELMVRVHSKLGDRLVYIGGLPTAETFALPYLDMGVTTYSSAIFNFLPDFANAFYASVRRRDHATIDRGLREFVLPYIAIRNRRRGYAVSIVKGGMKVIGRSAGPVRPPLLDLTEAELADLKRLVDGALARTPAMAK
jgi:5-dehydro-4-deoxyglucarate dehydratase